MRAPSTHWFEELKKSRIRRADDEQEFPLYPWIAPPLHPQLVSLIERWGVQKHIDAHEPVLGHMTDRVDQLVLVKSGLTVRHFGSPFVKSRANHAISVPGRLACGNLNFFSHRACVGRYYAIVPSTVISVPQSLIYSLCMKDAQLLMTVAREFEMIALTDRMGFGAQTMLSIDERLLTYFLSWSVVYGTLQKIDDVDWVCFPMPLRGPALQNLVVCSSAALERALTALKSKGLFVTEGDTARIQLECLKPIHKWLRNMEEQAAEVPRDKLTRILSTSAPKSMDAP